MPAFFALENPVVLGGANPPGEPRLVWDDAPYLAPAPGGNAFATMLPRVVGKRVAVIGRFLQIERPPAMEGDS